jgi:hypothetical protein
MQSCFIPAACGSRRRSALGSAKEIWRELLAQTVVLVMQLVKNEMTMMCLTLVHWYYMVIHEEKSCFTKSVLKLEL